MSVSADGYPFYIPAANARALGGGLINNVPASGTLTSNQDLFGTFDGTHWSLSGSLADATRTLTFQLVGTAQPPGTDSDSDGVPDVTDNCPSVANASQAQVAAPAITAPPAVTITGCAANAALALGQPTVTNTCAAPPLTVTNDAPATFPLGTTTVTWTASDGAGNARTATQLVTVLLGDSPACCPAGTNVIMGTSNNDVLTGTSGRDCIIGLGGQDRISGGGGDDYISGGDGDDILKGDAGKDTINGGSGQDQIEGGADNDNLFGNDGDDTCRGGDGNDVISGGNGNDHLFGDAGNDSLNGNAGYDQHNGGTGTDVCTTGGGIDTFTACETTN